MENTSDIEKLKLDVVSIDEFLKDSRTYITNATHDIMEIGKEENSLRLLYLDVSELDDTREKIESVKKMQEDMADSDDDTKAQLKQRMESLQKEYEEILERLSKHGIKNKDDYDNKMNAVKAKKESIADMKAEIKKKELSMVELEERKNTILARIKILEDESKNAVVKDTEENKDVIDKDKKDIVDSEEKTNADDDALAKDTKQKERMVSELAAFIDYQAEDENIKDDIIDDTEVVKKETKEISKVKKSLDSAIDDVLQKQEKVQNKFLEIIQENKDEGISKEIADFHEKFLDIIYKRINGVVEKLNHKRKFIDSLNRYANEYTKEMEDDRLTKLNSDVLNSIKDIEQEEQGLEGEVRYSFNELSEYAKNEFNYISTLQSRISDQLNDIVSKMDNIENELGEIKGNTKESILEAITNNQKTIDNSERKLRNVDSLLKGSVIELMENIKERMSATEDHEELKSILEDFKNNITTKENESDSSKVSIEEEIKKLEEEKETLEKKYNEKKDNESYDTEREALLLDSKKMLKDEVQKVVDMIGMLETRNNEFKTKLDEDKRGIKDKIKQYDSGIVAKKNELISSVNENMKSYKLRLFENIEEYNNEYTKEFDRYVTKAIMDIEELKKENNEIREKVKNIVVSSEFEENVQLFDNLKESLDNVKSVDKSIASVDKPDSEDKAKIEKTIETSLSYIKPEDTIDNKIDFGGIYKLEDNMQMVKELKENVASVCDRLEMDYSLKEKKEKGTKKLPHKEVRDNIAGLEGYDDDTREVLMDMSLEYVEELKNMNIIYNKPLYLEDLNKIKEEKVILIAKLKEKYQVSLEMTRKLYELKKYVLAYKKGMEELAKGAKSDDKDAQKEYNKYMKVATKSLKTMQENGVSSFEDFRSKVLKNSENVKEILEKTKSENKELVKLMSLIKALEVAFNEHTEKSAVGV